MVGWMAKKFIDSLSEIDKRTAQTHQEKNNGNRAPANVDGCTTFAGSTRHSTSSISIVFTGRGIPNATSFLFRFLINHEIPRSCVDFTPQLVFFFLNKPRVVHRCKTLGCCCPAGFDCLNIMKKGVDLRIDVENGPFSFQLGDALGPFQRIGLERSFGKEILSRKTQNNKTSDTTSTADQITFLGKK
jgi:hypothetical protein